MRKWLFLVAVLIAAYVGYPYLTLYWIDQALLTGDKQTLQRLVDFQAVREDLKAELKNAAMKVAKQETENRPVLGAFGEALAGLVAPPVVDTAVEQMVTPEAILNNPTVVEHREQRESFMDFVTYAFFTAPTRFRFDLKDPEKAKSPTIVVIMELVGPRWRVVSVDLPPVKAWFARSPN